MMGVFRNVIFVCCLFLLLNEGVAQTFRDVTYTSDDTNFANPERGFYKHTEVNSSLYNALSEITLRSYRQSGITLIIRVFYLEKFLDGPLSEAYLERVDQDFITARKAGVKIIVRFAYTKQSTAPYKDATPDRVLQHIRQLGPLLRTHNDVIAVMQAGFIGAWGEWYYTDHFSQLLGSPTEADWVNRRAVVNAMLTELPADRILQVRTPQIKRKLVQSTTALTEDEAFGTGPRARIGHHNDCFLASPDDYGTYINQNDEKPYLETETQYVPMGGETCGPYVPLSECPNAVEQMKRFHWSYLNRDYHTGVINSWDTGQCLDDVEKSLGYRFKLKGAHLQVESKPGGELKFQISLANEGWASPYNKRLVEIVLRNRITSKEYKHQAKVDPRKWLPGSDHSIDIAAGLPPAIDVGDYDVFLNLPSPELTIRKNADYSIRLANGNMWEAASGYNNLRHIVTISNEVVMRAYGGSDFFLSADVLPETLPQPSPLIGSAFGNNVLLYWGWKPNDAYRVIQRSDNGSTFETIATLPGSVFSFIDKSISANSFYSYRSFSNSGNAISPSTPDLNLATGNATLPPFYLHRSDGDLKDWISVKPLQTLQSGNDTYAFKLFADKDSLYFDITGDVGSYQLFIDHNNTPTVGLDEQWTDAGFDFRLKDNAIYNVSGSAWNLVSTFKSRRNGDHLEGSVPLSILTGLGTNELMHVALQVDDLFLPKAAGSPVDFIRTLAPASLQSFAVETPGPDALIVSWQTCLSCTGVILERSNFPDKDFTQIAMLSKATFIYYDETVVENQTYYYRAVAYNETGLSDYTAVGSGKPAIVMGILDEDHSGNVYPNPVSDRMTVRINDVGTVTMIDIVGRVVRPALITRTDSERVYDVSGLASGFYVVRIDSGGKSISVRIKK